MFKAIIILAVVAVAAAAPQFLLRSAAVIDNEGAKQVGLPYANGWTDGPNNGVGPVVYAAHVPAVATYAAHVPAVHHVQPAVYSAGVAHHVAGTHFVL